MSFKTPFDLWLFRKYLLQENRYVISDSWKMFLEKMIASSHKRKSSIEVNLKFFQAKPGVDWKDLENGNKEMVPLSLQKIGPSEPGKAKGGRFNPEGISYLYLSSDERTAIAESRAWVGAWTTIATYKIKEELTVIDARNDVKTSFSLIGKYPLDSPPSFSQDELEEYIWGDVNKLFSNPISPNERILEYVSTQYLGEFFKSKEIHGIQYQSSLSKSGDNLVLFYPRKAAPLSGQIFYVENVKYEIKPGSQISY